MNFIDSINYVLKKIFRDKKNIYYIIIISFCILIMLISLTFSNNLNKFNNESIFKNIGFRTLNIAPLSFYDKSDIKTEIEQLLKVNHIEEVYGSQYRAVAVESDLETEVMDGNIELLYLDKKTAEELQIKTIETPANVSNGYMICPEQFYPSSEAGMLKFEDNQVINGKELIGKKVTIKYNSYKFNGYSLEKEKEHSKTFEVIGTYDSTKYMNVNNQCYIGYSDIKEIVDTKSSYVSEDTTYNLAVIVDNINNVNSVIEDLEKYGYTNIYTTYEIDYEMVDKINISCGIVIAIVLVSIIIISTLYAKKKKINDIYNLGILKLSGYKDKTLIILSLIENSINVFVSTLIGGLIFIIAFIIVKQFYLTSFNYIGFSIQIYSLDFIKTFCIIFILTSCLNLYSEIVNNKKSISKLLNESEE